MEEIQLFDSNLDVFGLLPNDVVLLIFSHLPIKDIGKFLCISKRFLLLLYHNNNFWSGICNTVWKNEGLEKKLALDWAHVVSKKDWLWFAKCFSIRSENALFTWELDGDFATMGSMKNGKFDGWCIRICDAEILFGTFVEGRISSGGVRWFDGESFDGDFEKSEMKRGVRKYLTGNIYTGEFDDGDRVGKGIYETTNGSSYAGTFKLNCFDGEGTVTTADGFKFSGTFEKDIPKDREASIHPKVRECIQKRKCTSCLEHLPQFMRLCPTCELVACAVCWNGEESRKEIYTIWGKCKCECTEISSSKRQKLEKRNL